MYLFCVTQTPKSPIYTLFPSYSTFFVPCLRNWPYRRLHFRRVSHLKDFIVLLLALSLVNDTVCVHMQAHDTRRSRFARATARSCLAAKRRLQRSPLIFYGAKRKRDLSILRFGFFIYIYSSNALSLCLRTASVCLSLLQEVRLPCTPNYTGSCIFRLAYPKKEKNEKKKRFCA